MRRTPRHLVDNDAWTQHTSLVRLAMALHAALRRVGGKYAMRRRAARAFFVLDVSDPTTAPLGWCDLPVTVAGTRATRRHHPVEETGYVYAVRIPL